MASTSYTSTPTDIRRNRAARFSVSPFQEFEPPSFSLGIDIRPLPSFDECLEIYSSRDEDDGKSCKTSEPRSVHIENDEEGCFPSEIDQIRPLKRLKRGPPAVKEPKESLTRSSNGRSMNPDADSLPSVNHISNQRPEDGMNSFLFQVESCGPEGDLPPVGDRKRVLNLLKKSRSSATGESSKFSRDSLFSNDYTKHILERERDGIGGGGKFSKWPSSSVDDARNHVRESDEVFLRDDIDDIEELSEDELVVSGSRNRRVQPRKFGTIPILITSSPETSKKPILHIPGADFEPTVPNVPWRRSRATTDEIPVIEDDAFISDLDRWRSTRPELGRHGQTSYQLPKSTTPRADSVQNLASQFDVARDSSFQSFQTQTPLRRDTVGASQAFRKTDLNQSDESRIAALLRQRLPHYKPIDALLMDGGLDNEPIYIDYRKQFVDSKGSTARPQSGTTGAQMQWPLQKSRNRAFRVKPPASLSQKKNGGKKVAAKGSQAKKHKPRKGSSSTSGTVQSGKRGRGGSKGGPVEGKWRTLNGMRTYITSGGEKLHGSHAFAAYKGHGNSNKKFKKCQTTMSK